MAGLSFSLQDSRAVANFLGYKIVNVLKQDELISNNVFGLPIFMPFSIEKFKYKDPNGKFVIVSPQLDFPCCIIEIYASKNVIETEVAGRDGTVKEYISMGDYSVTIKGLLGNGDKNDARYPLQIVNHLHEIYKAPVSIPVVHRVLNKLGIYDLVIKELNLPVIGEIENLQAFELQCLSDIPIELVLKKESEILNG